MSLTFPVWILSLVTLGLLGVWRGSWLHMGICSAPGKRSTKQGEWAPSGSLCLLVTGLEVLPCPRVYPSNTSVTRLSCLPSPQQGLGSPGSPMPTYQVCSLGMLLLEEVALWFKVLCSCRAVMPWGGMGEPSLCTHSSEVLS